MTTAISKQATTREPPTTHFTDWPWRPTADNGPRYTAECGAVSRRTLGLSVCGARDSQGEVCTESGTVGRAAGAGVAALCRPLSWTAGFSCGMTEDEILPGVFPIPEARGGGVDVGRGLC